MPDRSNANDPIMCYKYIPFDSGSLCILTEGTLKYTNPLEFNDPFDCHPFYKDSLEEIRRGTSHAIERALGTPVTPAETKLSPAQRSQYRNRAARALKAKMHSGEWRSGVLRDVGVVSLSSNPTDILMWSHYADFHKGFVVGFRIGVEGLVAEDLKKHGFHLLPYKVEYTSKRPMVNLGSDSKSDQMKKILLTKSEHWKYEAEQRVIDIDRGPGIHAYDRDRTLNCVIAGMRMSDGDFEVLKQAVADLNEFPTLAHVKLYRAKASRTNFEVEIPGFPH